MMMHGLANVKQTNELNSLI